MFLALPSVVGTVKFTPSLMLHNFRPTVDGPPAWSAKMASRQAEELERNESQTQQTGQPEQQRPGMLGSLLGAVHDTYKHAKDAVVGKSPESATPAGVGDAVAAGEAKDEEVATEKSSDGDEVSGKVADVRGYKADIARRAMGLFADKKEETRRRASELVEATAEGREIEAAQKRVEKLKLKASEYEEEEARMAEMAKDYEVARAKAAKRNIFSAVGTITGAIKEKLTHPTDIVRETRAAREHGGARRKDPRSKTEEVVVVDDKIEETLPAALKASVQVQDITSEDNPGRR